MKKKLGTERNVKSIVKLENYVHTFKEALMTKELETKDAMQQLLISFSQIAYHFSSLNEELILAKEEIKRLEQENIRLNEELSR